MNVTTEKPKAKREAPKVLKLPPCPHTCSDSFLARMKVNLDKIEAEIAALLATTDGQGNEQREEGKAADKLL